MKQKRKSATRVHRIVIVPTEYRVVEPSPDDSVVHIRGHDTYATMCGLADDAYLGTGQSIVYGTRRKVSCQSCIGAVLHASQFVSR